MELIKEIYEQDTGIASQSDRQVQYTLRKAARAIVMNSAGKIALLFVSQLGYHKLPGGGLEGAEDPRTALRREMLEEVGAQVEILDEVGMIIEYRTSHRLLQLSYCFTALVVGKLAPQSLTQQEMKNGLQLKWVTLEEAIQLCRDDQPSDQAGRFINARDTEILLKAQEMQRTATTPHLHIRQMKPEDVDVVYRSLLQHDIPKPLEYIHRCWEENETGVRISLLAFFKGEFAGWLHLLSVSLYPDFVRRGIPEINNFDVVPAMRRLGIGNALMEAVERIALDQYGIVGIGVGLYADYGNAQRLYAKRGYVPDGRGVIYESKQVVPGSYVKVGDDLAIYMTKEHHPKVIPEKLVRE